MLGIYEQVDNNMLVTAIFKATYYKIHGFSQGLIDI